MMDQAAAERGVMALGFAGPFLNTTRGLALPLVGIWNWGFMVPALLANPEGVCMTADAKAAHLMAKFRAAGFRVEPCLISKIGRVPETPSASLFSRSALFRS